MDLNQTFKYEVVNAHWFRQCHPETCSCHTDYVVLINGRFRADVETKDEGYSLIDFLKGK